MAGMKRRYTAQTGITFDDRGLRLEAGADLPASVTQAEIEELIDLRAIKLKDEVKESKDESEGAKK